MGCPILTISWVPHFKQNYKVTQNNFVKNVDLTLIFGVYLKTTPISCFTRQPHFTHFFRICSIYLLNFSGLVWPIILYYFPSPEI